MFGVTYSIYFYYNSEKKVWTPTLSTKICSAHFFGGKKSENEADKAYIPTIFPALYGKSKQQNLERLKRPENRKKNKELKINQRNFSKNSINSLEEVHKQIDSSD